MCHDHRLFADYKNANGAKNYAARTIKYSDSLVEDENERTLEKLEIEEAFLKGRGSALGVMKFSLSVNINIQEIVKLGLPDGYDSGGFAHFCWCRQPAVIFPLKPFEQPHARQHGQDKHNPLENTRTQQDQSGAWANPG